MDNNKRNIQALEESANVVASEFETTFGKFKLFLSGTSVIIHQLDQENEQEYNLITLFHPNGHNVWTQSDVVAMGEALKKLGE